jgi:hypothetical protein
MRSRSVCAGRASASSASPSTSDDTGDDGPVLIPRRREVTPPSRGRASCGSCSRPRSPTTSGCVTEHHHRQ